jgi:hypothetical protein
MMILCSSYRRRAGRCRSSVVIAWEGSQKGQFAHRPTTTSVTFRDGILVHFYTCRRRLALAFIRHTYFCILDDSIE